MSPFYLSFLGPVLFIATLVIKIFDNAQVDIVFDSAILVLFILQNIPKVAKVFHPLGLSSLYVTIFFLLEKVYPAYMSSVLISSQISLYCLKQHLLRCENDEKAKRWLDFVEKKLKSHSLDILVLKDQIETLVNLPFEIVLEENFEPVKPSFENYDDSLDELEKQIDQSLKQQIKEEKKPLKRLRRIVMKQTSFFDDQI